MNSNKKDRKFSDYRNEFTREVLRAREADTKDPARAQELGTVMSAQTRSGQEAFMDRMDADAKIREQQVNTSQEYTRKLYQNYAAFAEQNKGVGSGVDSKKVDKTDKTLNLSFNKH